MGAKRHRRHTLNIQHRPTNSISLCPVPITSRILKFRRLGTLCTDLRTNASFAFARPMTVISLAAEDAETAASPILFHDVALVNPEKSKRESGQINEPISGTF